MSYLSDQRKYTETELEYLELFDYNRHIKKYTCLTYTHKSAFKWVIAKHRGKY